MNVSSMALEYAEFLLENEIVLLNDYKLKSGNISPYYFNYRKLAEAKYLSKAAEFYANAILERNYDFDVVFGPAYRGIPLAVATALQLSKSVKVHFSANRKELKDGSNIVGEPIEGKNIIIVDDVITAGKTIYTSQELSEASGAKTVAYLVSLDRQERSQDGTQSIREENAEKYDFDIFSVTSTSHLLKYLKSQNQNTDRLPSIEQYLVEFASPTAMNV